MEEITLNDYVLTNIDLETLYFTIRLKDEKEKDYEHIDFTEYLFDVYLITDILNDEVEILETTYKPDKIEKIKDLDFNTRTPQSANENEAFLMTCINWLVYKQGEIIDKLNKE